MDNNIDNLEISISLVDDSSMIVNDLVHSGKELIERIFSSDDWGAPPRSLTITSKTDDGKTVTISIPYKVGLTRAFARITEKE